MHRRGRGMQPILRTCFNIFANSHACKSLDCSNDFHTWLVPKMIGQGREIDIRGEVWSQNFHTQKFFFRKLAITLPFWKYKVFSKRTYRKQNRTASIPQGGWYNRMYWSAAYAVHGLAGSACSPVKVGSQRLRILNIPVWIRGFRASSRFWPDPLRTAQENWRCPSTTIITRDRAPTTVSPVNNRYPQSGLVHRAGLRYPLNTSRS